MSKSRKQSKLIDSKSSFIEIQKPSSAASYSVAAPPYCPSASCYPPIPPIPPKCPPLRCDAQVEVDLFVKPRVKCTEICQRDAYFDLALNVTHKPTCSIRHIRSEPISDCLERCVFRVDFGSDFTCKPEILCKPTFAKAVFDLQVDAKTKQTCRVVGGNNM